MSAIAYLSFPHVQCGEANCSDCSSVHVIPPPHEIIIAEGELNPRLNLFSNGNTPQTQLLFAL